MYEFEFPGEEEQPIPKLAIGLIIALLTVVITLVILTGLQQPDSSTQDGAIEFMLVTEEYDPSQDVVISVSNATLYVPKDAIHMGGSISISPRAPNLFSIAGETGWFRSPVVNVEYRDEAGALYPLVTFFRPVEICFKIVQEQWLNYLNRPNEYQVQYYAEKQNPPRWEALPMVAYPEEFQLCGQTDHFSLFALAIRSHPGDSFISATLHTPQGPYVP